MDVQRLRDDFPMLRHRGEPPLVHFDNAATSLKPRPVIDAVHAYLSEYAANVHRGHHALVDRASVEYERSRQSVARFVGARAAEIVFVRGTTEAANLVASGLALGPGDNVVSTVLEHHSNLLPWRARCAVRAAPLTPAGLPDLEAAEALVDDHTRLVAVTACSNVTGVVVPVAEWATMAHRHGLPLFVDAAQAVAHRRIDVEALDCDYLAFSGHKTLGPTGAGALYGKREALERLTPASLGGGAVANVAPDLSYELRELPWRLEAGTPDIAAVIGLGAAIDYLDAIGMDAIERREQVLCEALDACVSRLPGLTPCRPADGVARAPILSMTETAMGAEVLSRVLSDTFGILTRAGHHCAHPLHAHLGLGATLRVSLAFYNTEEELLRLRDALASLLDRGRA